MFSRALAIAIMAAMSLSAAGPNVFVQHNLVSDIPGLADFTDPNLVDPWSIYGTGSFWVNNHLKGNATVYNASGVISTLVVTVPPGAKSTAPVGRPTGGVANAAQAFFLPSGARPTFIFATEDGTISAFSGGTLAVITVDNSGSNAVYKGLAIGANDSGPLLYAANFFSGEIEVYDSKYARVTVPAGFKDPNLPAGFAPFNIWPLAGKLYVAYARQNAAKNLDLPGPGNGYVNVFDMNGVLLKRMVSGSPLNSPWGLAIAPPTFGAFANDLLVGNFGNGSINAFDINTGEFHGTLQDASGKAIVNTGLWAIVFGGGGNNGDRNTLYFVAGINVNGAIHGLLGAIAPPSAVTGIVNGASQVAGGIAPGEVVVLNGLTIGPAPLVSGRIPSTGSLDTTVATTSVTINGNPAPILYTSASATSVLVPYELGGFSTANVVVKFRDETTASYQAPVVGSAPGLFTTGFSGAGQAVAFNDNGTLNTAANPIASGSVIILYATGEGSTNPAGVTGVITDRIVRLPILPVKLTIGGQAATVLYAGSSPGQVGGIMEIEAIVPAGVASGAAPVVLSVGSASSQPGVTISVK